MDDNNILRNGITGDESGACLEEDRHFYFPESGEENGGVNIVWGNYNKCNSGYRIERSDYPYYVLEYIISGKGGFKLGNKEWVLSPGMIFGFPPHKAHSYWSDADNPLEKVCVVFTCSPMSDTKSFVERITGGATYVSDPSRIHALFSHILEEGINKAVHSPVIINHLLQALIIMVDRNISENKPYNHSYNSFLRCKNYIERDVTQKILVSEIAEACNMDSSYMSRLFRKYLDCTPNQYIKKILIEKSIDFLSASDMNIKEIAGVLGFSNQYHFSSFFKKSVHISPSQFRKTKGI